MEFEAHRPTRTCNPIENMNSMAHSVRINCRYSIRHPKTTEEKKKPREQTHSRTHRNQSPAPCSPNLPSPLSHRCDDKSILLTKRVRFYCFRLMPDTLIIRTFIGFYLMVRNGTPVWRRRQFVSHDTKYECVCGGGGSKAVWCMRGVRSIHGKCRSFI